MVAERRTAFARRYQVNATTGCWEWKRGLNHGGYGSYTIDGKTRNAHRVSYEMFRGEIPPGLDLDHLCRNRRCVNPDHLEAVTRSVNLKRGKSGHHVRARQLAKTECPKGHPYNDVNTYTDPRGHRMCKPCARQATRNWRARQAVSQ